MRLLECWYGYWRQSRPRPCAPINNLQLSNYFIFDIQQQNSLNCKRKRKVKGRGEGKGRGRERRRARFPVGAFVIFSVSAKASLPISLSPFSSSSFPFSSPFDLLLTFKMHSSHLSHKMISVSWFQVTRAYIISHCRAQTLGIPLLQRTGLFGFSRESW